MHDLQFATDMDGTLLNHHDYRFDAVLPSLANLQQLGIPVILNTNKTFAELEQWRERLNLQHPFIVENGSAVLFHPTVPDQVFKDSDKSLATVNGYQVVICGKPITELRDYLAAHVDAIDLSTCGYSRQWM